MRFAKRLNYFPEYIFSRLNKDMAMVEKISGRKVMNFGAGTPDFRPSQRYIKKLQEFIGEPDAHLYPGYKAINEFSDALRNWYQKRFTVVLAPDEIFHLLGAKDGISHLPFALLNAGDEVLTPDPGYTGFNGPVLMLGAKPISYNLCETNNFKLDLREIEKKLTKKTKFIWVNFPSNPTGQVITHEELEKLVYFAKRHDLFIVYDNAYSEITFDNYTAPSILEIAGAKDSAVELGSFSKTFSFAGFRMSWIAGNKEVIAALAKVKSQLDSGMTIPLQKLGAYALTNTDLVWQRQMIESYLKRRDTIAEHIKSLGMTFSLPKGALYIWAKIPDTAKDSETYCRDLLQTRQILFTPGTAFGKNGEGYARVSICINIDNIDEYF